MPFWEHTPLLTGLRVNPPLYFRKERLDARLIAIGSRRFAPHLRRPRAVWIINPSTHITPETAEPVWHQAVFLVSSTNSKERLSPLRGKTLSTILLNSSQLR